jgi:predicted nucleic acid-binding protein
MPIYFIDSSALVKRYRNEPGSQRLANLLESDTNLLVVSRLGIIEVSAALVRRSRHAKTPAEDLRATLSLLDSEAEFFDIIELDEPIPTLALRVTRKHGLRGADSIQLGAALLAQDRMSNRQIVLVSSDLELNTAAIAEGLAVENPEMHS